MNYQDFNRGGFEFRLVIDTSKLAEKLKAVQESINRAIDRLRDKIKNATREIDRAQAHVNELYGQIDSLNRKLKTANAPSGMPSGGRRHLWPLQRELR